MKIAFRGGGLGHPSCQDEVVTAGIPDCFDGMLNGLLQGDLLRQVPFTFLDVGDEGFVFLGRFQLQDDAKAEVGVARGFIEGGPSSEVELAGDEITAPHDEAGFLPIGGVSAPFADIAPEIEETVV